MTLNATAFPAFGLPTISVDFNDLVVGPEGDSPELLRRRMHFFVDLLDARLTGDPAWNGTRRILVGHSFGGMLGLCWWLDHQGAGPAAIDGMVLVSSTAGPLFDVVRLRLPAPGNIELRIPLAAMLKIWNRPDVTRSVKRLLGGRSGAANQVDFRNLPRPTDWAMDRAGWRNTDWRAMRSYRLALEGFDIRDRLANITIPVIVLHGTRDSLLAQDVAVDLARRLPHAELRVIGGAGHALPLTHGRAIQNAVADLQKNLS